MKTAVAAGDRPEKSTSSQGPRGKQRLECDPKTPPQRIDARSLKLAEKARLAEIRSGRLKVLHDCLPGRFRVIRECAVFREPGRPDVAYILATGHWCIQGDAAWHFGPPDAFVQFYKSIHAKAGEAPR
jgi:hypothetical protein